MVKQLNELNSQDRTTDNVTLRTSKLMGTLLNLVTELNDQKYPDLNLATMELDDLYRQGDITRTHINGFNTKLDEIISDLLAINGKISELIVFPGDHVDAETYEPVRHSTDWFRDRRSKRR